MNEINRIVFDVYNNLLYNDYNSNINNDIFVNLKKFFRYIISGYIFEINNSRHKMKLMNKFTPTDKHYKKKVVIYTSCYGNYDSIRNPIYINDNFDYVIFTDQNLPKDSIWKKHKVNIEDFDQFGDIEKSRFVKINPHIFFKSYDYSMYIDSNILITCNVDEIIDTMIEKNKCIGMHNHQVRNCTYAEARAVYASGKAKLKDIKKQMNYYYDENFPKNYGLFENNIIIRKHNDINCISIMEKWRDEFYRYNTKRDQLSFMFSLWKNGLTDDFVMSLGNNSRMNPYFIVGGHK